MSKAKSKSTVYIEEITEVTLIESNFVCSEKHRAFFKQVTKKKQLTVEEKAFNAMLSKLRIVIEHINRELKIFRICKETYRGKGKRGFRRVKLIASLYNHRVVFV